MRPAPPFNQPTNQHNPTKEPNCPIQPSQPKPAPPENPKGINRWPAELNLRRLVEEAKEEVGGVKDISVTGALMNREGKTTGWVKGVTWMEMVLT